MDNLHKIVEKVNEQFNRYDKIFLRTNFTQDTNKQIKYTTEVICDYNKYIDEIYQIYDSASEQEQTIITDTWLIVNGKIHKYINKLNIPLIIPPDYRTKIELSHEDLEYLFIERDNKENESTSEEEFESSSETGSVEINKTMAMSKVEFLALCGRTINKIYEGNPLEVRSFVDSVQLLEEFAENADLTKILINFTLSKLNGSVREKVPENPNTVKQITDAIINKIRPESSDIIEGRLLALRTKSLDEFQEKAEKLAESLERALILEGCKHEKAKEMSVKTTVNLCRKRSNAPDVRSVLSSTPFKSPKEVIAKMITQMNVVREERMSDFFKKNNKFQNRKPQFANKKFSGRGGNNNNQNRDNSNNYKGNKFKKGQFSNNYQGRGNKNGNNNNQRGGYNNNSNNNSANIRTYSGHAENSDAPQQHVQLGAGPFQREN